MLSVNRRLLIVGGTGRNTGKTEFCCRLIAKISRCADVYALKVSAILPDEALYHGDHRGLKGNRLFEELRHDTDKDSSRMLRAGASRVFYLQGDDNNIRAGYREFTRQVPDHSVVVCESNSLATIVRPALLVVVTSAAGPVKPRSRPLLESADLMVISDGRTGFPELDRISLDAEKRWQLQQPTEP